MAPSSERWEPQRGNSRQTKALSVMPEIHVCHCTWCLLLGFRQLCFKGAGFGHFTTEHAMLSVLYATLLPKSFCTLCEDPVPLKQIQDFFPKAKLPKLICSAKFLGPKVFLLTWSQKLKNCSNLNFNH